MSRQWQLPDNDELEQYAERTHRSLIARLHDWQDQKSWDEFYRSYWRLIYNVATKAGLAPDEAWDVVQETVLSVAKQARRGGYDAQQGSFKNWLWNLTRWRINDQLRKRTGAVDTATDIIDKTADSTDSFSQLWEKEWQENLIKAAAEKVKMQVSPRQFQIFDFYVLKGLPAAEVRRKLGVSLTQVYLAKHRIGSLLRKEISIIQQQGE
ncbi:MAG: sigma-70 family RNA polymerase sigma factor [Akkermansia sp.]|nr:sigma-70 family RNA polymerase sigma factor [Akkermansia sp.]